MADSGSDLPLSHSYSRVPPNSSSSALADYFAGLAACRAIQQQQQLSTSSSLTLIPSLTTQVKPHALIINNSSTDSNKPIDSAHSASSNSSLIPSSALRLSGFSFHGVELFDWESRVSAAVDAASDSAAAAVSPGDSRDEKQFHEYLQSANAAIPANVESLRASVRRFELQREKTYLEKFKASKSDAAGAASRCQFQWCNTEDERNQMLQYRRDWQAWIQNQCQAEQGTINNEQNENKSNSNNSASHSDSGSAASSSALSLWGASAGEIPSSHQQNFKPTNSIHQPINLTLLTDSWLDNIVWTADDIPRVRPQLTSLFLELNSPELFELVKSKSSARESRQHQRSRQRKRTQQIRAIPSSTARLRDKISAFDYSLDYLYEYIENSSQRDIQLQHAEFAELFQHQNWSMTEEEYLNLHRPSIIVQHRVAGLEPMYKLIQSIPTRTHYPIHSCDAHASMSVKLIKSFTLNNSNAASKRFAPIELDELTPAEGELIVLEYLERFPLLSMNSGMASRFINYYRKKSDNDDFQPSNKYGKFLTLGPKEKSPFLAEIAPGESVTAIENDLFIAPIAEHSPPSSLFLLIRHDSQWFVRKLPAPFIVGQLEPKKLIPVPYSTESQAIHMRMIQTCFYRCWIRNHQIGVSEQEIRQAFPTYGFDYLFETLSEVARNDVAVVKHADGTTTSTYTFHANSPVTADTIRGLLKPEDVCVFESLMCGLSRLHERNIRNIKLLQPDVVSDLLTDLVAPHIKRTAAYIEKQLQLTPWSLSGGFHDHKARSDFLLQIDGRGNPFLDGCGVSFLIKRLQEKKQENKQALPPTAKEPAIKTGTDADLRKLTMKQLENALRKFGAAESEFENLPRWERVRLLSSYSTENVKEGGSSMSRFARLIPATSNKLKDEHKQKLDEVFKRQLAMLKSKFGPDASKEIKDDPAADESQTRKVQAPRDAKSREKQDREEYENFLKERKIKEKTPDNRAASPGRLAAADFTAKRKIKNKIKVIKLEQRIVVTEPDGQQTESIKIHSEESLIKAFLKDLNRPADREAALRHAFGLSDAAAVASQVDSHQHLLSDSSMSGCTQIVLDRKSAEKFADKVRHLQPSIEELQKPATAIRQQKRHMSGRDDSGPASQRQKSKSVKCKKCGEIGHKSSDCVADFSGESSDEPETGNRPSSTGGGSKKIKRESIGGESVKKSRDQLSDEEVDQYVEKPKTAPDIKGSNRNSSDSLVRFSSALKQIIDTLSEQIKTRDLANLFLKPVSKTDKFAKDYYTVINHPISVSDIRMKINANQYHSRKQFVDDFRLMHANSVQYNGDSPITSEARDILTHIESEVYQVFGDYLRSTEGEVQVQLLNERVGAIASKIKLNQSYKAFRVPYLDPNYLSIIGGRPMAISNLIDRSHQRLYTTPGLAMADVRLLRENSIKFNQVNNPAFADLARDLYQEFYDSMIKYGYRKEELENDSRTAEEEFSLDQNVVNSVAARNQSKSIRRSSIRHENAQSPVRLEILPAPKNLLRISTASRRPTTATAMVNNNMASPAPVRLNSTLPVAKPLTPAISSVDSFVVEHNDRVWSIMNSEEPSIKLELPMEDENHTEVFDPLDQLLGDLNK